MGIGDAHQIQHALNRAVFARYAMQRIEYDVGRRLGNPCGNITIHVDPRHTMAPAFKSVGDTVPAHERDFALVGPTAHQDNNMKFGEGHLRPTR